MWAFQYNPSGRCLAWERFFALPLALWSCANFMLVGRLSGCFATGTSPFSQVAWAAWRQFLDQLRSKTKSEQWRDELPADWRSEAQALWTRKITKDDAKVARPLRTPERHAHP